MPSRRQTKPVSRKYNLGVLVRRLLMLVKYGWRSLIRPLVSSRSIQDLMVLWVTPMSDARVERFKSWPVRPAANLKNLSKVDRLSILEIRLMSFSR